MPLYHYNGKDWEEIAKDGYTPIKGKDYSDGQPGKDADEEQIIKKVIKEIPKHKEKIIEVKEIVKQIKTLPEEDKLSYDDLKDTPFIPHPSSRDYNFTELKDAPSSYQGQTGKIVQVKSDETGLEFATSEERHYAKYYRSSNQTGLTVGGETTIDWNVTQFDTDPSWYDSGTKRWTPTLAGKYKVVFQVVWASTSAGPMGDFTEARIYRAGTVVANNGSEIGWSVYGDSLQIVAMISMNGTTDYLEWKILSPGACISPELFGGISLTYTTMEYLGT